MGWKNSGKTSPNRNKSHIAMDKRETRDWELQGQTEKAWEIQTKLNEQNLRLKRLERKL